MISKLRFSLIAVIMLVLLGFGFQNQAKGQVGLDGLFCPAVPNTTGWLETEIVGSGTIEPDFTGALIGTVENSGPGVAVGGLDWQHVDSTFDYTPTPTNETGSQLVTWWTQIDDRNTYIQVTNAASIPVTVHVRIHNEDCSEIRDFCDTYTGYDTHEYNFGDLFSNGGADIPDGNLQGVEGWVVVTAVENCASAAEVAIRHDALAGQLVIHDGDDYLYGVNTYARQAVCFDEEIEVTTNLINDGSFEDGNLGAWNNTQGNAGVIDFQGISPNVIPPDGEFMAFVASSARDGLTSGTYNGGTFNINNPALINSGLESNVSVIQSNFFTPLFNNTLNYSLSYMAPSDAIIGGCDNYAAVLLIDANDPSIEDAICYNEFGNGGINTNNGFRQCKVALDDNFSYVISPFEFAGGRSNFFNDSFDVDAGTNYTVQVVTGQIADDVCNSFAEGNTDTGALVDGFEVLETTIVFDECNGVLTGAANAMLDIIRPNTLAAQFNILPGNDEAGADVVHINFYDDYGPPYRPVAAFSDVFVSIFDADEQDVSCGDSTVCFVRLGIDEALIDSDNFVPGTPTPTPTGPPTPTPPPTLEPTETPTPTPTQGPGNGSSSCAVAGSPVQLGTALANVLIPLVPVAFAFGVRAARRRKK